MNMRWISTCWILGILISTAGCVFPWNRMQTTTAPVVFSAPPTKENIIAVINQNTQRIAQLESQVKVSFQGLPSISGNLALERPMKMRLRAELLGMSGTGVDLGSNDQLFWIWIKSSLPGQQSAVLFARHHEFATSPARQMVPIEPSWIKDALGLIELDPNGDHQGPFVKPDGNYEIHSRLPSATGDVTKVTLVDHRYGWVLKQDVFSASGQLLASARSSRHQHYPHVNVSLPQRVEISMAPGTQQQLALTLDVGSYTINQLGADPNQLWNMPQPNGIPVVDLARPPAGLVPTQPQQVPSNYSHVPDLRTTREPFRPAIRGQLNR